MPGVANLSETKRHNFPCAAAKSDMRHVAYMHKKNLYAFNDSMHQLRF